MTTLSEVIAAIAANGGGGGGGGLFLIKVSMSADDPPVITADRSYAEIIAAMDSHDYAITISIMGMIGMTAMHTRDDNSVTFIMSSIMRDSGTDYVDMMPITFNSDNTVQFGEETRYELT